MSALSTFQIGRVGGKTSPVVEVKTVTFRDLAVMASTHLESASKDTPGWTPGNVEVGPRTKDKAIDWPVIVLDIEGKCETLPDDKKRLVGPKAPDLQSVANDIDLLGWSAALASSWWHEGPSEGGGTVGPRYRIVFEISRPVKHAERKMLGEHISAMLGLEAAFDSSVKDVNRFFYLPAAPAARMHLAQSEIVDGRPINVDAMLAQCTVEHEIAQAEKAAPPAPRPHGNNVIAAFNEASDFATILARHGYRQIGTRWLSPVSTSGEPGIVIFKNGRLYCHHHGDPLFHENHARDLFDVWATLEHGGDQRAAVKAAAKMLGIGPQDAHNAPAPQFDPHQGGHDAARNIAVAKTQIVGDHPLAKFLSIGATPKPPRMILPGFIGYGVLTISGQAGAGKTTAIVPTALIAAGLIGGPLAPAQWRHVVYVSEDVEQVRRIICGVAGAMNIDLAAIEERFHLVEAVRLWPADVAAVGDRYADLFTRSVECKAGTVAVPPLVVFDTKSAVFSVENENDNAEASELIQAVKQRFANLPAWIVGHLAKANFGKADAIQLSARGAGAIEADAHQTAYVVDDGGTRWIILGKRRFEAKLTEVELVSDSREVMGEDEFGSPESFTLRWAIPTPSPMRREEARAVAAVERAKEEDTRARTTILTAVENAWAAGNPIGRTAAKGAAGKQNDAALAVINTLLGEGWLQEIEVPRGIRTNVKRSHFLVRLTDAELRAYRETGALPSDKQVVPATWRKPANPFVPDTNAQEG